jgi:starch synthase
VRVLFASAELAPLAAVGGLAQAAAGLVRELASQGVEVEAVLPDYGDVELADEERLDLEVPSWARPAVARRGRHDAVARLTLIELPGIRRPHPYVDGTGAGWPDNDARFLGFSVAVAALARAARPDVVHLNDWHSAAATAGLGDGPPSVLTVHNLAYQGWTGAEWVDRLGARGAAFARDGGCNPLAGGIALAEAVVVVSPTYREEVLLPETGAGLDALLREREDSLLGIRNGIDAEVWNPAQDLHLPAPYDARDPSPKQLSRAALLERLGLPERSGPLAVAVTRLVEQKGVDLLLPLVPRLGDLGLQLAILGAGEDWLARQLHEAAVRHPASLAFVEGYDEALSHLLLAGGDLLVMPSRFEPCGLAQMQAMRYGTLPVVTDVGGLHDTVVDLDEDPDRGTGWRAAAAETAAFRAALGRAVAGWSDLPIRAAAQRRGMTADWSWAEPAAEHVELYRRLVRG